MKKQTIFVAGLAVMAAVSLIDAARSTPATSKGTNLKVMFQAKYDARDAAWSKRNLNKYLSFFADDYVNYSSDGSVRCSSKQEYHDVLAPYILSKHKILTPYEVVKAVQPSGGGMIVTLAGHKGVSHRDFWMNSHGIWLIKQYRAL